MLPSVSRSAEFRSAKVGSQLDSLPTPSLLHGGICAPDIQGVTAIQIADSTRAYSADVGR